MEWSAPFVILVVILVTLALTSAYAMHKYPKVDDFVKVMGVYTGLFGVTIGGASSYFFTRPQIDAARHQAAAYKQDAEKLAAQLQDMNVAAANAATGSHDRLAGTLAGQASELAGLRKEVGSLRTEVASSATTTQKTLASLTASTDLAKYTGGIIFSPTTGHLSYTAGTEPFAVGYKASATGWWDLPPCRP
jgi:hypothetical protein